MSGVKERVGALPEGCVSVCLPLWACVEGKRPAGWQRVGSLTLDRRGARAEFFGADAAWEPAWRVASGMAAAYPGDARGVAVFAVMRAGARVEVGRATLTDFLLALGAGEVASRHRNGSRFFRRRE